jgi:drug/metabolite transporter (DMT)-like permease
MPAGLLLGLGAALMWGLTDVCASIAGRRLGSLRVLAASQLAGAAVLVIVAAALGEGLPTDPRIVVAGVLVGLAGAGAYLSFFTALRIGPLSVVSPITAAYGGLTVILAVIFRGESLSLGQAGGAALATTGVVLAGLVFDGGLRSARVVGRGVAFAMVALVLFAVMTIGSAEAIAVTGWLPLILLARITQVVVGWSLLAIGLGLRPRWMAPLLEAPQPRTGRAVGIALAAGLLDAGGLISFAIGLERAETWLVGLASSFGPAVAVVVAVAFLGERLRPTQWLGLAGIAAGLAVVALA